MSARLIGRPRVLRDQAMSRRFVEAWNTGLSQALLAIRFELSKPGVCAVARQLRARGELVQGRGRGTR